MPARPILASCLLAVALCTIIGSACAWSDGFSGAENATVYSVVRTAHNRAYEIVRGQPEHALAFGVYTNLVNTTGWGLLDLNTNPAYHDSETMYAVGFLESFLTAEQIYSNYVNIMGGNTTLPEPIYDFLQKNYEWTMQSIERSPAPAWYWEHVSLVLDQFAGLVDGYHAFAPSFAHLDAVQLMSLSANGDIGTLQLKYNITNLSSAAKSSSRDGGARCSGFVKLTDDLSELFFGHTTWIPYSMLLRIYKNTHFPLRAAKTVAALQSFSSFPGFLTSTDDYFVMSSGLAVLETTNANYNSSRWVYVEPTCGVASWIRTLVANRVASSGASWVEAFFVTNSLTYNNQWVVVDYNLFTPYEPLPPGVLWVAEQYPSPGLGYMAADVTDILQFGFWASYNVPFFDEIYNTCGFPQQVDEYGPFLSSYQLAARAQIFRRNQSAISSEVEFQAMMRYNDYLNDPLSAGCAGLGIASRFDLVNKSESNPQLAYNLFGGVDSKITSYRLMSANGTQTLPWAASSLVQSSPTHDQQPVFCTTGLPGPWLMMPTCFDFGWITVTPGARP